MTTASAQSGQPGGIPTLWTSRGSIANSLMKAAIAAAIGEPRFKWQAGGSLVAMAAAGAAALMLF